MTTLPPTHESKAMRRKRERIELRLRQYAGMATHPQSDIFRKHGYEGFTKPGSHKH